MTTTDIRIAADTSAAASNDRPHPIEPNLDERLAQLLYGGYEFRAADRAGRLDPAGVWLTTPSRWQGHHGGASMHLTDGIRLVWHANEEWTDTFSLAFADSPIEAMVASAHEIVDLVAGHLALDERHHRHHPAQRIPI